MSAQGIPPLRDVAARWGGGLESRLALAGLELREEKIRLVQLATLIAVLAVAALFALLSAAAAIILLLPEPWRVAFGGTCAVGSSLAAWLCYRSVKARLANTAPFGESLQMLRKDRQCLETKN